MRLLSITLLLLTFTSSCAKSEDNTAPIISSENLIRPGVGVGKFEIGVVTLQDIRGSGSSDALDRLFELGIGFHSNQGKEITEVIVSSDSFSTKEGIRVGSSAIEVREIFGPPISETSNNEDKGIEIPLFAYEGIGFVIEKGKVSYIVVAGNQP